MNGMERIDKKNTMIKLDDAMANLKKAMALQLEVMEQQYVNSGNNEKKQEIERRKKAYESNIENSGMEGEEKTQKFSDLEDRGSETMEKMIKRCEKFVNGTKRNLILAGAVGVGKTHLACAVAKALGLRRDKNFHIIRCSTVEAVDLLDSRKYIVILDDMGRELGTSTKIAARRAIICEIIEKRDRLGLITIVTTNMGTKEMILVFKAHIYDRLVKNSDVPARVELDSYRQKKGL